MAALPRPRDEAEPTAWLGDTPLLNLRDDKLRLRVKTVTQFSRTEDEKLRSICEYVASIPFNVPAFAGVRRTRVTLAHRHAVGWYSKAALFQAMLRTAGIPARIRMIRVDHAMYRGLADTRQEFVLPVVELWTAWRWIVTDNYVYDPRYLAAAQEAVASRGWNSGFGVHLDGKAHWDGRHDAVVMIALGPPGPQREKQFIPGLFDDPAEPAERIKAQSWWKWFAVVTKNRIMSIRMNRAVAALRAEAGG